MTALESETPAGQFASATGEPLTGFSGTGGLIVAGVTTSGHTAGPGVGSVTVPVRSPHQTFDAETGVPGFGVRPSSVVLGTPNAWSAMLLRVVVGAPARRRRPAGPSRRCCAFAA